MQSWGENLLAAAAVGIVGWIVMRLLVSALRRALARTKADDILTQFIALVAKVVLMGVVAVLMLERLGVQTTSLVAGLGALGLALGLALQDSLKNFAAGLLLIARRLFKAEDFVEAGGTSGIVEDINREGVTVILVEQNAELALQLADHAYVLETGSLALEGPAKELHENDHVRKAYLGG